MVAAFDAAVSCYPGVAEERVKKAQSTAPGIAKAAPANAPSGQKRPARGKGPIDQRYEPSSSFPGKAAAASPGSGRGTRTNAHQTTNTTNLSRDPHGGNETSAAFSLAAGPSESSTVHPEQIRAASGAGSRNMLLPPPPFVNGNDSDMQAELEKLLTSYYEAGYRAGRYQAMREAKRS